MRLTENVLFDHISKIEVGDQFVINTIDGGINYTTVAQKNGSVLVLRQDGTKVFQIDTKSGLVGDTLIYLKQGENKKRKLRIKYIGIKGSDKKMKTLIRPELEDPKEKEDNSKEKSTKNTKNGNVYDNPTLVADLIADRTQMLGEFRKLKQWDFFKLYTYDNRITKDGVIGIDSTETITEFHVEEVKANLIYCTVKESEGKYKSVLRNFYETTLIFDINNLIDKNITTGVAVLAVYQQKKKITFKNVHLLEVVGSSNRNNHPSNEPKELEGNDYVQPTTPEPNQEVYDTPELRKEVSDYNKELLSEFKSYEVTDIVQLFVGDTEIVSGHREIKKDSDSIIEMMVTEKNEDHIVCKLIKVEGKYSTFFQKDQNEKLMFYLNEKLIDQTDISGSSIQFFIPKPSIPEGIDYSLKNMIEQYILTENSGLIGPFFIKSVYAVQLSNTQDGGATNDEVINGSNFSSMLKNKDLIKMMHHRTWFDRLIGRNGKGVVPMDDIIKNSDLIKDKQGQEVNFEFLSTTIRSGQNLKLEKNKNYHGKYQDGNTIKMYEKYNTNEFFLLHTNKNSNSTDLEVEVVYYYKNNNAWEKKSYGFSKIVILN